MRATSSCTSCRARKRKCNVPRPGRRCKLCALKDLECNLEEGALRRERGSVARAADGLVPLRSRRTPGAGLSPANSEALSTSSKPAEGYPPPEVCHELVDLYFDLVHDKQHILFHRESFVVDQRAGRVAEFLVLGVIALVARFSSNPYFENVRPCDRARPWMQQAMRSFYSRSELIDIPSLQGSILLGYVAFVEGDTAQDALLAAQAIRMVQALRLPVSLSPEPIQREVEIRLYWQVWMMETWHTTQAQLPKQLTNDPMFRMPLEERTFHAMRPEDPPDLFSETRIESMGLRLCGFWSSILPLTEIHGQVVRFNDEMVHSPKSQSEVRSRVKELSLKLDIWLWNLPRHLRDTPENRMSHAERGLRREFAVQHMIYHHQSQLLYFQFLSKAYTPAEGAIDRAIDSEAVMYADRCKAHAALQSELMWDTNSTPGMECLWSPVNGHLLVIASSVHLHTLLFDTDSSKLARVRKMLEQNFIMLLQLQKYWPTLEYSLSRLRSFHRACQMNNTRKNFDIDRWMIDFLNRYGSRVSDRYMDSGNGLSPSDPIVGTPAAAELWQGIFGGTSAPTAGNGSSLLV